MGFNSAPGAGNSNNRIDDPEKAKSEAKAGNSDRTTAMILREAAKGNLAPAKGHHMESQIMATLKDSSSESAQRQFLALAGEFDNSADTQEKNAGALHDIEKSENTIDDKDKAEAMAHAGKHAEDHAAEVVKKLKDSESRNPNPLDGGPIAAKHNNLIQVANQSWDAADRAEDAAGQAYDEAKAAEIEAARQKALQAFENKEDKTL